MNNIINKSIIALIITITFSACSSSSTTPTPTVTTDTPPTLTKGWETPGLNNPESVVQDTTSNALYVSSVYAGPGGPGEANGMGYISKINLDGTIAEKNWVSGLGAPKGMAIVNGKLYVADITQVHVITISTKAKESFTAPDANFLNDITADASGDIYISNTFGKSIIYKMTTSTSPPVITKWSENTNLNQPNGLLFESGNIYVANWGIGLNPATFASDTPGSLLTVKVSDKSISTTSSEIGNLDGLVRTANGFLMTDYLAGTLLYYSTITKKTTKVIDLKEGTPSATQGPADLYYNKTSKILYIPLLNVGKLVKYTIK